MIRKISLLLSAILILTLAFPVRGFAAGMDAELENAIKIAKAKFSIPESYKFESNISTSGTRKIYYLSWRSEDTYNSSRINVSVDGNGMIISYNKYTPSDYVQKSKLPKISRQEAKAKADEYIERIEKGLLKNLRYQESDQVSIMDSSYYLNYYRVVNGIPFYNDRVYVNINRDTGELQSYSRQWTDSITFKDAVNTITAEAAEKAYAENLGLRLIYRTSNKDDILKAYAVYVPIYDNSSYGIDAFTGERRRFSNNYYIGFAESTANQMLEKAKMDQAAGGVTLSPDELNAVAEASKLLTLEDAEKIARESGFLSLSTGYKLQSYYLNANWPEKSEYIWSLQFNKPAGDTQRYDEYTSVTINAKSGIITGFYRNAPETKDTEPKEDIAAAKAAVDAFLSKYYPQYYRQMEYDKLASEGYLDSNTKELNYNLVYSRIVNGIPYPDNGVSINYDNINGMITGFNLNWYGISFPSIDNVIGVGAATEKLFDSVGLGLEYKIEYTKDQAVPYSEDAVAVAHSDEAANVNTLLLYALNPNKPLYIDANTGELLNYSGDVYKEPVKISYTDIKGHFAEKQITVLADYGIYLEGTEFKPREAITQLDFMTLLSKTLSYYGPIITLKSSDKDIDDLYAYLMREGIIREGEKAPESTVSREEAVKYIIRALKYDRVADIKGIYNCSFRDKNEIDSNLVGYVTIAAGMGIVSDKSAAFRPKDKLSRGESAVMIYNYLQQ